MTTDKSPEGAQDEAPALQVADMLLRRQAQRTDALEAAAAMLIQQLTARVQELERERDSYKLACDEWAEKTEWVQQTVRPSELGMHRADALRERIERAADVEREACALLAERRFLADPSAAARAAHRAACQIIAIDIRARGAQGDAP